MVASGVKAERKQSNDRPLGGLKEQVDSEHDDSDYEMADPTTHDREILLEEEERERLLQNIPSHAELKRTDTRSRGVRKRKRQQRGEKAELMSEMEEGDLRDDTSSLSGTSSLELEGEGKTQDDGKGDRVRWLVPGVDRR